MDDTHILLSPRPSTPFPDIMQPFIDLRTPSILYNHGGYYAPIDPRDCNTPGGPCSACQERIDEEAAAAATLLALTMATEADCPHNRPTFLEPCPFCHTKGTYVTHASKGLRTCNGCDDKFCTNCYYGSRYCCAYVYPTLSAPSGPIQRQLALGVQSPKAEEKTENK